MAMVELAGTRVEVDDEGFMVDNGAWNREIAVQIASQEGIDSLTDRHWDVIEFMRKEFEEKGSAPSIRRLKAQRGHPRTSQRAASGRYQAPQSRHLSSTAAR